VEPTPQQPDSTPTVDKKAAKPGRVIAAGLVAVLAVGGLTAYNTSTYQLPPAPKADKAVAALIPAGAYSVDGVGTYTGGKFGLKSGEKPTSVNATWKGYVNFDQHTCEQKNHMIVQNNFNHVTDHYLYWKSLGSATVSKHYRMTDTGPSIWKPLGATWLLSKDPVYDDAAVTQLFLPTTLLDSATTATDNRFMCVFAELPYLFKIAKTDTSVKGSTSVTFTPAGDTWYTYQRARFLSHVADVLGLRGYNRDRYIRTNLDNVQNPNSSMWRALQSRELQLIIDQKTHKQEWLWIDKRSHEPLSRTVLTPTAKQDLADTPEYKWLDDYIVESHGVLSSTFNPTSDLLVDPATIH